MQFGHNVFECLGWIIETHREAVKLGNTKPDKSQKPAKRLLHAVVRTLEQVRQMAAWFAYIFALLVCGPLAWPEITWPQMDMASIVKASLLLSSLRWGICGTLAEFYENNRTS